MKKTVLSLAAAILALYSAGSVQADTAPPAANKELPSVILVLPSSAPAGTSFPITIAGINLTNATNIVFVSNDPPHTADPAFKATDIKVLDGGAQVTATISVGPSASVGTRLVRVVTPKGTSTPDAPATGALLVTAK